MCLQHKKTILFCVSSESMWFQDVSPRLMYCKSTNTVSVKTWIRKRFMSQKPFVLHIDNAPCHSKEGAGKSGGDGQHCPSLPPTASPADVVSGGFGWGGSSPAWWSSGAAHDIVSGHSEPLSTGETLAWWAPGGASEEGTSCVPQLNWGRRALAVVNKVPHFSSASTLSCLGNDS